MKNIADFGTQEAEVSKDFLQLRWPAACALSGAPQCTDRDKQHKRQGRCLSSSQRMYKDVKGWQLGPKYSLYLETFGGVEEASGTGE